MDQGGDGILFLIALQGRCRICPNPLGSVSASIDPRGGDAGAIAGVRMGIACVFRRIVTVDSEGK